MQVRQGVHATGWQPGSQAAPGAAPPANLKNSILPQGSGISFFTMSTGMADTYRSAVMDSPFSRLYCLQGGERGDTTHGGEQRRGQPTVPLATGKGLQESAALGGQRRRAASGLGERPQPSIACCDPSAPSAHAAGLWPSGQQHEEPLT